MASLSLANSQGFSFPHCWLVGHWGCRETSNRSGYKVSLCQACRVVRFPETEGIMAGARGRAIEPGCFMGIEFWFGKMKRSGNGCAAAGTVVWVHSMPLALPLELCLTLSAT